MLYSCILVDHNYDLKTSAHRSVEVINVFMS